MPGSGKQIPHVLTCKYNLKTLQSFKWQESDISTTLGGRDWNGSSRIYAYIRKKDLKIYTQTRQMYRQITHKKAIAWNFREE